MIREFLMWTGRFAGLLLFTPLGWFTIVAALIVSRAVSGGIFPALCR